MSYLWRKDRTPTDHAGHASAVTDFAWNPSINDEWTLASCDQSNLLQAWRPSHGIVSASVQPDAFDQDDLDDGF